MRRIIALSSVNVDCQTVPASIQQRGPTTKLPETINGIFEVRNLILTLFASAAAVGMAAPAMAHPDGGDDQHEQVHDQLNDMHDNGHDQLDALHEQAHEEGMSPWEHRRLHRYLDRQHARMHDQLSDSHDQYHDQSWQGYYGNGYNGYNNRYYGQRYYRGYNHRYRRGY